MEESTRVGYKSSRESGSFKSTLAEKMVEIMDNQAENFFDADQAAELGCKVEGLEWDKLELQRENKETKEKIQELTAEIQKLKSSEKETNERLREMELEIEQTEEGKDMLESVANRATELGTEMLQHGKEKVIADTSYFNLFRWLPH